MLGWLLGLGLAMAGETPEAAWLRGVLERPWEGVGVQDTNLVEGGRLVTSHTLTWKANETMQLSGSFTTKLILGDMTYHAMYSIKGEYLASMQSLAVNARLTQQDTLPGGIGFCNFTGTLKIGNDSSRPGHFAIVGPLEEDCGGSIVQLQLADRGPDPAPAPSPTPAAPSQP
jgi:hypothetical protein